MTSGHPSAAPGSPADDDVALSAMIRRLVADKIHTATWSERSARDVSDRLNEVCRVLQWVDARDVPADAFARIADAFAHRGPSYIKFSQLVLGKLVRWPHARGLNPRILQTRTLEYAATRAPLWQPEAVRAILRALRAPKASRTYDVVSSALTAGYAIAAAEWDYQNRRALYPVIWMMVHWALRPEEARHAQVSDWDPRSRRLTVRSSWIRARRRTFVVDRRTAQLLTRVVGARPRHDPLFPSRFGRAWTQRALQAQFERLLEHLHLDGSLLSCVRYALQRLAERFDRDWGALCAITGHSKSYVLTERIDTERTRKRLVRDNFDQLSRSLMGPVFDASQQS